MADKKYPADRLVNRRRINGSTGHFFFPNRNFTNWRLLRNSYHMSPDFSANDGVKFFLQGSGLKDRCSEPQWRAGGQMLQGVQDSSLRWLSLYLGSGASLVNEMMIFGWTRLEKNESKNKFLGLFGDDGAEGRNTVFNLAKLIAMKKQKYCNGPNGEPKVRLRCTARERRVWPGFIHPQLGPTLAFANGTTNQASRAIINSFFRNQTFPPNWFRAAKLVTSAINGATQAQLMAVVPVAPGRNNAQGVSVAEPAPPPPWNSSSACAADFDLQGNIPNTIWNTTGIFKQNVELLTGIQFTAASANAGCNQQVFPFGPTGV
ncbi:hypothetical protein C8J57DRAFT_1249087 [Mycena rebaudengoi]|nr:hypothetical protein C8J57DRAFT_1249087 [Mycena rebaudengoi]